MIKDIILLVLLFGNLDSTIADFKDDALKLHNSLRTKHSKTPGLSLNKEINSYSQNWAKKMASSGNFAHSDSKGKYGENLYLYEGPEISDTQAVTNAVNAWYDEISKYNFDKPGFSGQTGHFTQVVWKGSKQLGIAVARSGKNVYVSANYSPAGNVISQFPQNVLKK